MFLTASRFETDSHSSAVQTARTICSKKNCQPLEWLKVSIPKKSSAVQTAQAIRSKKKNRQSFERLKLSVQKIVSHSNDLH